VIKLFENSSLDDLYSKSECCVEPKAFCNIQEYRNRRYNIVEILRSRGLSHSLKCRAVASEDKKVT
jgi:hypothetical protein